MSKCIVRVFTFFFSFLATWKDLKRWNETHPEHEALEGLGTWEGQGSRLFSSAQLSSAVLAGEQSTPQPPRSWVLKCFCVFKGLVLLLGRILARKLPLSEVRHRSHSAKSSTESPPEKCCLLHRPEGPVCGSSAYLKILSPQFFQFCVFHKFSSLSWWVVVDYILFWPCGSWRWGFIVLFHIKWKVVYCGQTAQLGWAIFSRLTRNYYYYFKEQFCGSVVMLLP